MEFKRNTIAPDTWDRSGENKVPDPGESGALRNDSLAQTYHERKEKVFEKLGNFCPETSCQRVIIPPHTPSVRLADGAALGIIPIIARVPVAGCLVCSYNNRDKL